MFRPNFSARPSRSFLACLGLPIFLGLASGQNLNSPESENRNSDDDLYAIYDLQARCDLARALLEKGEFAAASLELEKSLALGADPFTMHALLSTSYLMSGDLARAAAHLAAAHTLNPDNPDLLALEGQFELSFGNRHRGEALLEALVVKQPQTAEARLLLLRSYLQTEALEKAKPHLGYLLSLEEGPFTLTTLVLKARYDGLSGKYEEALQAATEAYAREPGALEGVREFGLANLHMQRYEIAKPLLEHAWNAGPRDPQMAFALGELHFRLGDWEAAESYWKQGHRMNPLAYPMAQKLFSLYLATGRIASAENLLGNVQRLFPDRAESQLLHAFWARKMGQYAKADHQLLRLIRLGQQGELAADVRWEQAQLEFESGRHRNCEKLLKALIEKGEWVREATQLQAKIAFYRSENEAGSQLQAKAQSLPVNWPKTGSLLAVIRQGQSSGLALSPAR